MTYPRESLIVVAQKDGDGNWNGLHKAQNTLFDSLKEAADWLDKQPQWFRDSNAVFELLVTVNVVEKKHDPYRSVFFRTTSDGKLLTANDAVCSGDA